MKQARALANVLAATVLLSTLAGCDKLKEMISKSADAAVDATPVVAAPVPSAPEDAGVDAAPVVTVVDDIPGPADEEARANRDIGFGNFKEELDKLEKEPDKKK